CIFFFSSRRRHTRFSRDWSSDVCSSDLMDILDLYPVGIGGTVVQALVTVFGEDTREEATKLAAELRAGGINTELYLQDRNVGRRSEERRVGKGWRGGWGGCRGGEKGTVE